MAKPNNNMFVVIHANHRIAITDPKGRRYCQTRLFIYLANKITLHSIIISWIVQFNEQLVRFVGSVQHHVCNRFQKTCKQILPALSISHFLKYFILITPLSKYLFGWIFHIITYKIYKIKNRPFAERLSKYQSWRKREDSNLRDIAAHTISSRAPSTTRPRFHLLS